MKKPKYRTFREVEEEYLRNHPEEIDDYIKLLLDEYAESDDIKTLLTSLQSIESIEAPNN